jgi:serine phosphatase RsbU (regulator of sigma subunit)
MFNRFKVTQRQKRIIEQQQRETKLAKELVEEKNREIFDSMNYAKRLQEAILPHDSTLKKHFIEYFIMYQPKDIVAGDFYWFEIRGNKWFFAVADCTGHGVPGAMVSVVCSNALNRAVQEFNLSEPGKILDKVRDLVLETFESKGSEVKDGMDIALVCIENTNNVWNIGFAGANNPLLILRNGANELEEIKADKQPVGRFAVEKPFKSQSVVLQKGDTLYFYTDGYPDQFGGDPSMGPAGKKLKAVNMKKLILSIKHKDMTEQGNYLRYAFEKWKGDLEQIDDVCMAGIKF